MRLRLLSLFLLSSLSLLAQNTPSTKNVTKAVTTNALTEDLTIPAGRSVTFAVGAALVLPDNALQIGDVSGLQTTLDAKANTASLGPLATAAGVTAAQISDATTFGRNVLTTAWTAGDGFKLVPAVQGSGATGTFFVSNLAETLLDDTSTAAMRSTLGLGALATAASVEAAQISDATAFARALLTTNYSTLNGYRLVLAAERLGGQPNLATFFVSDFARTYLDDEDAATTRSTLGLGALATASGVTAAQISDATAKGRTLLQAADVEPLTAAEKTKLAGIAAGATANATDAALRERATHTGTQAASTITGLATVATSGSASDLTGALADARLSANVPLRNAANTYTHAAQVAPSWRLPAYAGTETLPVGTSGMGWDELGRFTLQTPVGAFQVYEVGSPAVPTLYWPGTIISQRSESLSSSTLLPASNITSGAGSEGLSREVLWNSLTSLALRGWAATAQEPAGIPTQADSHGIVSGAVEFVDGNYFPRAVVSDAATQTSVINGDFRTAAQLRTDLGLGSLATASGVTAAQISDSSAAGRTLLTAADAPAQRTALGLGPLATESGWQTLQARKRRLVEGHVDFMNGPNALDYGISGTTSGGAITSKAVTGTQVGLATMSTGTTASTNQRAGVQTSLVQFILPNLPEVVWYANIIPQVNADGTNTGIYHGGMTSTVNSLGSSGAYFYSQNGGNLFARTIESGTSTGTNTDTGIPFTVGTELRLEIRSTGTSITFYVNEALVATHSTNIPTAALGFVHVLVRHAATTESLSADTSYMGYRIVLPADRY